jgi:hypothetical protein
VSHVDYIIEQHRKQPTETTDCPTCHLIREVEKLRCVCAEAYQVVGALSLYVPDDYAPIVAVLDNLSDAADGEPLRHPSFLPFSLPEDTQKRVLGEP